jgi:DNA-binding transcriptional MerR regulator
MKEKKETEYISTGEAARILGVSIFTVQYYFDRGILNGRKHPITGRRSVSIESLLALMEKREMKSESGRGRPKKPQH